MLEQKDKTILNDRLRQARLARGWTQQEVADAIGTTKLTVGRWERGERIPQRFYWKKLCEVFGADEFQLGLRPDPPMSTSLTHTTPAPPPPLWTIPYPRNPFFVGRASFLKTLCDRLQTQPQAITGLAGMGKTQLAIEYAYHYARHYTAVLWMRADTSEALASSSVLLAELLDLPERHEQEQQRTTAAVVRWLMQHPGWLLILDNLEEVALLQPLLPVVHAGSLLLTTRLHAFGALAQPLELPPLSMEEATFLLLQRARLIETPETLDSLAPDVLADAHHIAESLGGLPLAVDQAGAYIEEMGCSIADYRQRYQEQRALMLRRRGSVPEHLGDHPLSVTATLLLSLYTIEQTHPAASDLLSLCAFLHPDAIPEELFTLGAAELEGSLCSIVRDPCQFDTIRALLRASSLLSYDTQSKTLSIHRLVQSVLIDQLPPEQQRHRAACVVRLLHRVFPDPQEVQQWPLAQRCLTHASLCASHIANWHLTVPEAAPLLSRLGKYLLLRGQYDQVEPLYQQALALQEQQYGLEHHESVTCLYQLGELYDKLGDYSNAERVHQQALQIRERVCGPEHPDTAESLNDLALQYSLQGAYEQAEPLYRRALAIFEQQLGPHHPATLMVLNNLARLTEVQQQYALAERLYHEVLRRRERYQGAEHPDTALALHNLAAFYREQRNYAQAERLFQQVIALREHQLGPEHPDTAQSLNALAMLYTAQERYDQAEIYYQRALRIREHVLGRHHPKTALTIRGYAGLLRTMGRQDEAEALEKQV